jgi:hypothetical protein
MFMALNLQVGHQQLGLLDDALLARLLVDLEDLLHDRVPLAAALLVVVVLLGLGDHQRTVPGELLDVPLVGRQQLADQVAVERVGGVRLALPAPDSIVLDRPKGCRTALGPAGRSRRRSSASSPCRTPTPSRPRSGW